MGQEIIKKWIAITNMFKPYKYKKSFIWLKYRDKNEGKMMTLKKVFALLVALPFSLVGCAGLGPNAAYYIGTTSFQYDPSYSAYMTKLNGKEIGGGFGGGMNTSEVKLGPQIITWRDAKTGQNHTAKNQVILTRDQLKGKKYLAAHLYPDDTVEITTSNDWPEPTEKGLKWLKQLQH